MNTLPIHLDRLTKALENAGIRVKRNKAIEIAAAAFGYRNSNALVAADKAGTLPPPASDAATREPWPVKPGPYTARDEAVLGEQARISIFDPNEECVGAATNWAWLDPYDGPVDPGAKATGQLFAASPTLRDAIEDLLDWERAMGGFASPAWERARKAIADLREATNRSTEEAEDEDDEENEDEDDDAIEKADGIVNGMTRDAIVAELEAMGEGLLGTETLDELRATLVGCLRQDGDAADFVREHRTKATTA